MFFRVLIQHGVTGRSKGGGATAMGVEGVEGDVGGGGGGGGGGEDVGGDGFG